jgi:hypothetical protein
MYFIVHALYQNDRSLEEMVYEYKQQYGKSPFSRQDVEALVDKGYILNLNGIDDLIFDEDSGSIEVGNYSINLKITPMFEKMFFVKTEIAGEELYNAYPGFLFINGVQTPLKKGMEFNGQYLDRRKLSKIYARKIGNNRIFHQKIIDTVKRVSEMKQLNVSIKYFIMENLWEDYFKLEDNSQSNLTVL